MKYSVLKSILKKRWHTNIFVIEASIEGIENKKKVCKK